MRPIISPGAATPTNQKEVDDVARDLGCYADRFGIAVDA